MIDYLETSALLRWLLGTPEGPAVSRTLRAADRVVTSRLTLAEARRVLLRGAATESVPRHEAGRARSRIDAAAVRWTIMAVTDEVWTRAESPFPVEPLRTLDALYLATALRFQSLLGIVHRLSSDPRVIENWRALALPFA